MSPSLVSLSLLSSSLFSPPQVTRLTSTPDDRERFETLTDINTACTTAVEILNDLLTFEKMESGILELHKEAVPALGLVRECIAMFAVHARSKEIEVVPVFDIPGTGLGAGLRALSDTDIVQLDRFKMSQVLHTLFLHSCTPCILSHTLTYPRFVYPTLIPRLMPMPNPHLTIPSHQTRNILTSLTHPNPSPPPFRTTPTTPQQPPTITSHQTHHTKHTTPTTPHRPHHTDHTTHTTPHHTKRTSTPL
jgi:hypothetical protein